MANRMVKIGSFVAKNQQGRSLQIVIWSRRGTIGPTFSSSAQEQEISRDLLTPDGAHVNYLDHGKYELALTREVLTSDDPSAP